jgi:hypothetical protein
VNVSPTQKVPILRADIDGRSRQAAQALDRPAAANPVRSPFMGGGWSELPGMVNVTTTAFGKQILAVLRAPRAECVPPNPETPSGG